MRLSPKTRRNISQILPFGVIWLLVGWADLIQDALETGTQNIDSSVDIALTPKVFLFASIAVTLTGLMIGTLEVLWFKNLFSRGSFFRKLFSKFLFYSFFLFLIIAITYPTAAGLEAGLSPLDPVILEKFNGFMHSGLFINTMMSLAFSTFLSLFYSAMSDHLGHKVLSNFFTGKYHQPVEEERIFMFLDMKSSTTIAEKLGHLNYFNLLREYYAELSDAIVQYEGEIYQYVGDEIVISWELDRGIRKNNCLHCFYAMQRDLKSKATTFQQTYGVSPSFKAGLHVGRVTTGEIGALKRELFFTGDVLNVTARIQNLCNSYNSDLLVSDKLLSLFKAPDNFTFEALGPLTLKGRKEPIELFAVGLKASESL